MGFKRNNGNWGYNHRLHRGWGKISESWIEQHEDSDGHDVQETPNHRRNNVDKVNERRYKYEDHVMSHRSHWRELITRGELVDGADKDDQSTNSAQETSDVKIFSWSAADLGCGILGPLVTQSKTQQREPHILTNATMIIKHSKRKWTPSKKLAMELRLLSRHR